MSGLDAGPGRVGRLSRLGLGTVQFGLDYGFSVAKVQSAVDEILDSARELGITFIDTARAYGDSEAKIGDHLRRRSYPGLAVATKLAPLTRAVAMDPAALRRHVIASVSDSRAALGRDRLDIVLLHQSDDWLIQSELFWDTVAEVQTTEGLWGEFGVSVYDVPSARHVLAAAPAIVRAVEIPYNIFDRRFAALATEFERHRIRVISRSAFLKGLLPLPTAELPEWATDLVAAKRRLDDLAAAGRTSVADLALRSCLRARFIESTIVGVDSPLELRADVGSLPPRPDLEEILDEVDLIEVDPEAMDPRRWLAFGF